MAPRKPNYRFERQERERAKQAKKAEKAARKGTDTEADANAPKSETVTSEGAE
jgi:hypothetical protein